MIEKYQFSKIDKKFPFLNDKSVTSLLEKWNVQFNIASFNYDKAAEETEIPSLLKHFFEDEKILDALKVLNRSL